MDDSMSMSGDGGSTGTMMVMMTPWLHFTGGDNFFFKSLHPSSHGTIAAACIVLVLISVFERWVSAIRNVLYVHWQRSALALHSSNKADNVDHHAHKTSVSVKETESAPDDSSQVGSAERRSFLRRGHARSLPPFIASNDIPRGLLFAFQALLAYILMLAVMTFQAAYIISIVAGLGIGEVLFGRMGSAGDHTLH
ncbi:Ctr copper transporter [Irpex rosettiformis]|uniref:Ctr copper transporter n=1 Tax=Irpex rosettiformis TaxID=378272 RepID=A0ACB8TUL0_9APHY|nr:Ctr copper transporter [Irpex rosettiformis]